MRATLSCLGPLSVVLAAGPVFPRAAQGTTAIPAGSYRSTLAFGDRVLPSQIRGSPTAEPRLQIALPVDMRCGPTRRLARCLATRAGTRCSSSSPASAAPCGWRPGAPGVARRSDDRDVGGVGTRQFDATHSGQTRSHRSQGGYTVCGISHGPRCSTSA
jgi:hypothetical protein